MAKVNGISMDYASGYPSGSDVMASNAATAMLTAEFNRIAYQGERSGTDVSMARHMADGVSASSKM